MGLFRTNVPSHLIPVNPQNATSYDWAILLEAGTIIGPSPERLRVARSTLERKIIKKYKFMRAKHFLVLEGYDPRIHGGAVKALMLINEQLEQRLQQLSAVLIEKAGEDQPPHLLH